MAVPIDTTPASYVLPFHAGQALALRQSPGRVLPIDALTIVGQKKWVNDFIQATPHDVFPWVVAKVSYAEGETRAQVMEIMENSWLSNRFSLNWHHLRNFLQTIEEIENSASTAAFESYGDAMEQLFYTDEWNENIWLAQEVMKTTGREHQWGNVYENLMGTELHALAARHLIQEDTAWNQAAYDVITTPYRRFYGPVHPDDPHVSMD
ncbi:hypothetical protein ACX80D_05800 [Arthrobacter sp. Sr24]